jgi:hypothetical protein
VHKGKKAGPGRVAPALANSKCATVYPVSLSPLPNRIAVVALLVYIVFRDGGNLVEATQRLLLGLDRTANGKMAGGEGARWPTNAKAPPLSALAIGGDIEYVRDALVYGIFGLSHGPPLANFRELLFKDVHE